MNDAAKELKIKHFRGVFLPKKPWNLKLECGIINLADSNDLKGTHWVCYRKNHDKMYYFDSYGLQPPLEIEDYLNGEINYNEFQIQDFDQVVCGHLCLYVLSSKLSFDNVIFSLLK